MRRGALPVKCPVRTQRCALLLLSSDAFNCVFETTQNLAQARERLGVRDPEAAPMCFEQTPDERARRMRIQLTQASDHLFVKDEGARHFIIDPIINSVCS